MNNFEKLKQQINLNDSLRRKKRLEEKKRKRESAKSKKRKKRKGKRGKELKSSPSDSSFPKGRKNNGSPSTSVYHSRSGKSFLLPSDMEFQECKKQSYNDFAVDNANVVMNDRQHLAVEDALELMRRQRLFTHDVVATSKRISTTFVERTLVGRRGMTYHYQRLRLFAYPWEDEETPKKSPLRTIRQLNETLKARARVQLSQTASRLKHENGSCDFNVVLINYMQPEQKSKNTLRKEPDFDLGLVSVSWHMDSSLQPFSTIAVYHQTTANRKSKDWRVALRVQKDNSTPALVVPLQSHQAYYMLRDFNHHHHHAVLTGTSSRYSTTHRVGVEEKDTIEYIEGRCEKALLAIEGKDFVKEASVIRLIGEVQTEIEMQWLRMFWVQGKRHADSHKRFWLQKISKLLVKWKTFEKIFDKTIKMMQINAKLFTTRSMEMMLFILNERVAGRREWKQRTKHKCYAKLSHDLRPMKPQFYSEEVDDIEKIELDIKSMEGVLLREK
eukprot:g5199.t1